MNLGDLVVTVKVNNSKKAEDAFSVMKAVREKLLGQPSLGSFDNGSMQHISPIGKPSFRSDKSRKRFTFDVISAFDAACIEHLLERFEISVLLHEAIR
jgi:hypothetical protein